jgi:hypothetical protein
MTAVKQTGMLFNAALRSGNLSLIQASGQALQSAKQFVKDTQAAIATAANTLAKRIETLGKRSAATQARYSAAGVRAQVAAPNDLGRQLAVAKAALPRAMADYRAALRTHNLDLIATTGQVVLGIRSDIDSITGAIKDMGEAAAQAAAEAALAARANADDMAQMWVDIAKLTPDLTDDIVALNNQIRHLEGRFAEALASQDPRRISEAAGQLGSARESLTGLTAPTVTVQGDLVVNDTTDVERVASRINRLAAMGIATPG